MIEVFNYLSKNIYNLLNTKIIKEKADTLEEIRLRGNKNIILKFNNEEMILSYKVTAKDLLETLEKVTENSIYTYEKQISQGFITLAGGHRVGVVGNAINEDEKITKNKIKIKKFIKIKSRYLNLLFIFIYPNLFLLLLM